MDPPQRKAAVATRPCPSRPRQRLPFAHLPAELRLQIYSYLEMPMWQSIHLIATTSNTSTYIRKAILHSPLLHTSSAFRDDYLSFLLSMNRFSMVGLRVAITFLQMIGESGRRSLTSLEIILPGRVNLPPSSSSSSPPPRSRPQPTHQSSNTVTRVIFHGFHTFPIIPPRTILAALANTIPYLAGVVNRNGVRPLKHLLLPGGTRKRTIPARETYTLQKLAQLLPECTALHTLTLNLHCNSLMRSRQKRSLALTEPDCFASPRSSSTFLSRCDDFDSRPDFVVLRDAMDEMRARRRSKPCGHSGGSGNVITRVNVRWIADFTPDNQKKNRAMFDFMVAATDWLSPDEACLPHGTYREQDGTLFGCSCP